jgi:general secretion pathway protein G
MENRRSGRAAFTLIELMVVLLILGVLAAVVVPLVMGRPGEARRGSTITQIGSIKTSLASFMVDNGRYPRTEEGLEALVTMPAELEGTWKGPYLEALPVDGWGRPFVYRESEDRGVGYLVASLGEDGEEGTGDDIDRYTRR